MGAGVTYALYTVNAQSCFDRLHPVPFTWVSFGVTLVLSGLSLVLGPWLIPQWGASPGLIPEPGAIAAGAWTPLWIGALLSSLCTVTAHLLTNLGIRAIGATTAAMVSATNPTLTVLLAWLLLQEQLGGVQLLGVAIVTVSVALLSREHQSPDRA